MRLAPADPPLRAALARSFRPAELERLGQARVGIAGCGGLGSNCAMLLARSGVRRLTLIDFDRVEPGNLNRQFFFPDQIGALKVEALAEHLRRLVPDLELTLHPLALTADNITTLLADCPVVVEALDQPAHKALLCNALLASGVFVVAASGLAGLTGPPMRRASLGHNLCCVGDFTSDIDAGLSPLAPRVVQAAALQAEAVLARLLEHPESPGPGRTPKE